MENKHQHKNEMALLRRRRGLSRAQVAEMLKLHVSTIRKYEQGTQLPPLITALKLEILYRRPVAFLYPTLYSTARGRIRALEESGAATPTEGTLPTEGAE